MRRLLRFILSQLNFEGVVIMTIFEQLAALRADVEAIKALPAKTDDDAALEARVTVLEGEIGTPPAPAA